MVGLLTLEDALSHACHHRTLKVVELGTLTRVFMIALGINVADVLTLSFPEIGMTENLSQKVNETLGLEYA